MESAVVVRIILRSTIMFNAVSDTINVKGLKSKETAKRAIKKNVNNIQRKLLKKTNRPLL
jgi:hypothetical protein